MDSLVTANTKFCLDLFKELSKDDGANIFICPLSISAAFGMISLGAKSSTAGQINQVLHFNEISQSKSTGCEVSSKGTSQEVQGDHHNLVDQKEKTEPPNSQITRSLSDGNRDFNFYFGKLLQKVARIKSDCTLSMANRLYGDQEFPIYAEYSDNVMEFYHTTIESLDFQKDTEKSRQQINFWVECQSQGKIKELFGRDSITDSTVLVLVNAVYFKAKWEKSFDHEKTEDSAFWLNKNEQKNVKMMRQQNTFRIGYIEELNTQILEMNYTKGKLSMFVLLPPFPDEDSTGLEELERNMTHEKITEWTSPTIMCEEKVDVSFPQFTMESNLDLNFILQKMGIVDIFDEAKADLSGISSSPNLYLSKAIHKTFVEVSEDGTEAAAATGAVVSTKSASPYVPFYTNHPFLFFIKDNKTNTILFYGKVCSP
ncbi:serpin B12 [Monodelphis domestica]|uniref:serpin B12 n=1 Tax=Monodelphis domestica TaxID=13616 RepID=UPI0024E19E8F|nr:serpin B12 [Monodelphis domestica]XP_007486927.2 serpin B12 [Monodelphis domestica]XP_056680210.1 serpin B12 [Monodelphis domestica]XP_056680211.1 serpin B12 [Monodelphis domestica]